MSQSVDTETTVVEVMPNNREGDQDSLSNLSNLQVQEIRQSSIKFHNEVAPEIQEFEITKEKLQQFECLQSMNESNSRMIESQRMHI